jgi:hypothetical protein
MSVVDLDILTVRNKNVEVAIRLVEFPPGNWRVYKWNRRQCQNWSVTVGRRFTSRFDALSFIQKKDGSSGIPGGCVLLSLFCCTIRHRRLLGSAP